MAAETRVTRRCPALFILPNLTAYNAHFNPCFVTGVSGTTLIGAAAGNAVTAESRRALHTGTSPKKGMLLIVFWLVVAAPVATAQDFVPLQLHGARSTDLMAQIDAHLSDDMSMMRADRDSWVQHVRYRQATFLKQMVRARAFVDNDSLQRYVGRYFERLVIASKLTDKPRLVLIMNSPESNAACYGSGVFIVTTGLLANMPDEASLAFILAHEVAHDELLHVQQTLRAMSRERESRNPGAAFARILLTGVNVDYIDAFRTTMYASAAMSRGYELKADSLALYMMQRAGYQPAAAQRALHTLSSLHGDKVSNLFASFHFKDFPFKEHWLHERLKVYHRKPANTFLWSFDSLRSHPQMERRIRALRQYDPDREQLPCESVARFAGIDSNAYARVSRLMSYQSVEAAYQTSQYDIALHGILRLLRERPGDPYLVSRAAGILIDVYHAKNEGDMHVLSRFTSNLSESERMVNNFLFNMSKEEVAELAYHFLNSRTNFHLSNPSHYYLLWETCHLTSRNQVGERVAASYRSRFGTAIENFSRQ